MFDIDNPFSSDHLITSNSNHEVSGSLTYKTMLRPSETANDLFRRLNNDVFDLRLSQERTEKLQFGSTMEVQSRSSEITEVCCSAKFAIGEFETHLQSTFSLY